MPGSCDAEIRPALERASGRRVGETLGLCYSPEFIALGSVIRDMLEPDMVLIGESDPRAGDVLERLYAGVCENDPPFRRMSLVNAELTKIAVNTYVTMKISYANALADMCERLPGADVEAVTDALGLDTRIGREVPARSARVRRALLPARQQGVRRARPRSRRRAAARGGDRRGQRRPDRSACACRPVPARGGQRGRDPRAGLQTRHRRHRREPGRRACPAPGERRLRGPRLRPGRDGGRASMRWEAWRKARRRSRSCLRSPTSP